MDQTVYNELRKLFKKGDPIKIKEKIAELDNINDANAANLTPLALAVWHGNGIIVEHVLALGGDPNYMDAWGETPVSMAAAYGYPDILKMLLAHGGRKDSCKEDIYKRVRYWNRLSPEMEKKIFEILDQV